VYVCMTGPPTSAHQHPGIDFQIPTGRERFAGSMIEIPPVGQSDKPMS
jgi:hypothetical protein